jgi:SAM-dependent methyltransferase
MREEIYTQGEYFEKNPTWHIEDSPWKAEQLIKIIDRNHLQPTTICEVGCGAGEILNQLYYQLPQNIEFTGYEISPQAYALCQKRVKERLQFYLKNFVDDKEAFFDLVIAIDLIEHIENCYGFLRDLHKKAEYKIIHVPLELSVQTVLRSKPIIKSRQDVGHIHYFTKETAMAILADTGYKVLDYFYTGSSIDLPVNSFRTLFARLPRKIAYKISKDLAVRILGGYSLMILAK